MTKRRLCLAIGLAIGLMVTGCSSKSNPDSDSNSSTIEKVEKKGKTVSGTVLEVDDSRITINTDSGETIYFTITDDTEFAYVMPEVPEKPEDEAPEKPEGEAPEKPEGEIPEKPEGEAPEKPEGETQNEEAPDKPVLLPSLKPSDLKVDQIVVITYSGKYALKIETELEKPEEMTPEQSMELKGIHVVDGEEKTIKEKEYSSDKKDRNLVLVKNKGSLTLKKSKLSKTGATSKVENSDFFGLNAVLAVQTGSSAHIKDTVIKSDAKGANAVFATGSGTIASLKDVKIRTKKNSSRGLDATFGGVIEAKNVDIKTKGEHSAPLATDRGAGDVNVIDATLVSEGKGSPLIYSTGTISVDKVSGIAKHSEIAVVEGKNSISMKNCDFESNAKCGIMLYQSTSGDAIEGTAELTVTDSRLTSTSKNKPFFYVTNTDAKVSITDTDLLYASGILLQASGNKTKNWGEEGANGGELVLTAKKQKLFGNIICDDISSVTMSIKEGSVYEGTINAEQSKGYVDIRVSKKSKLVLTGDSYVTVFRDGDDNLDNIVSNGFTIYYDPSNDYNAWLNGATVELYDGGKIEPLEIEE